MRVSQTRLSTNFKKAQNNFGNQDGFLSHVVMGDKQKPICISGNSTLTVLEKTDEILKQITSLVEQCQPP